MRNRVTMEILMDPETQRLVNLLKAMLRILGFSHREIARRLGMSPSYLSKLFSGVSELRLDHVIRICRAANLEPAEFFSLAYPRQPEGNSLAARKLRELLQAVQLQQPSKPQTTLEEEKQMEETLRTMLDRLLGRQSGSA
jgi:transcriptional regulator with XRE-family HTH domain